MCCYVAYVFGKETINIILSTTPLFCLISSPLRFAENRNMLNAKSSDCIYHGTNRKLVNFHFVFVVLVGLIKSTNRTHSKNESPRCPGACSSLSKHPSLSCSDTVAWLANNLQKLEQKPILIHPNDYRAAAT